ncbi:MAG: HAD-IIA family hydrolase [Actinomycetes bacterium]
MSDDAAQVAGEGSGEAYTLLGGQPRRLVEVYDAAFIDLDGVVYTGEDPVPGAVEALAGVRRAGLRVVFVTNNASRTPAEVAGHLARLGIAATDGDVVTSAQAAARQMADLVPPGSAVLVVGGGGLVEAVRERGLRPVVDDGDHPAAVVSGFHPDVGWRLLAEGTFAVRRGVPWVSCNDDLTLPTPRGPAPGNGALVEVIRSATGREPVVAGKPYPPLHEEAVRRTSARRPLVVGDRLDTDVEGAVRAGVDSLLVLTGLSSAADLVEAPPHRRPRYVGRDLAAVEVAHPGAVRSDDGWTCGGWYASVSRGEVVLRGCGDALDGLRAVLAATWSAPGKVRAEDAVRRLGW